MDTIKYRSQNARELNIIEGRKQDVPIFVFLKHRETIIDLTLGNNIKCTNVQGFPARGNTN